MAKYDSDDFSNFYNADSDKKSDNGPVINTDLLGGNDYRNEYYSEYDNTSGRPSSPDRRDNIQRRNNNGKPTQGRANMNNSKKNPRPSTEELKMKAKYKKSKRLGVIMTLIQLLASVVFMGILYFAKSNLDAFVTMPVYIGLGVALFVLFLITFNMQFKKLTTKRIGKVLSIIITVLLVIGSYFLYPLINVDLGGNNKVTHKKPFVVYLSGNDTFDELSKDSNGRSDTNIVAVINPETYTALLISTPRDAYLELLAQDIPAGNMDKLTHAGLYGTGVKDANGKWGYGCDVSMNMLGELYDLNINHYLKLNFTGFANLVDALGGVTIDIPQGFTTTTYGRTYTFKEGTQKLDGSYALTYVRERKSFANGDLQRGSNQTAVIKAIVDQAVSANAILNYNKVMDSISKSFDTDLDISSLAKLQLQIQKKKDFKGWNIVNYAVTGTSGGAYQDCYSLKYPASVVFLNDESVDIAKQMAHLVLDGKQVNDKTAKQLEDGTYGSDDSSAEE